ncbi:MAG TPA: hypothetical protein PLU72_17475 [Candidatus Ozemobacteraceae bacterium]|nr:hypothetical protein [Candidatus Ozemobacteraceae bacterium]HQG27132.1 hypothetical protein [Candidatus Ozemobacteraceae bacterium]
MVVLRVSLNRAKAALARLEKQYENLLNAGNRPELTALDKEALFESVLCRFKHCYQEMSEVPLQKQTSCIEHFVPKGTKHIYERAIRKGYIRCSKNWIEEGDRLNFEGFLPYSFNEREEAFGLSFIGDCIRDSRAMLDSMDAAERGLPSD